MVGIMQILPHPHNAPRASSLSTALLATRDASSDCFATRLGVMRHAVWCVASLAFALAMAPAAFAELVTVEVEGTISGISDKGDRLPAGLSLGGSFVARYTLDDSSADCEPVLIGLVCTRPDSAIELRFEQDALTLIDQGPTVFVTLIHHPQEPSFDNYQVATLEATIAAGSIDTTRSIGVSLEFLDSTATAMDAAEYFVLDDFSSWETGTLEVLGLVQGGLPEFGLFGDIESLRVVPEPSSTLLMASAIGMLAAMRRR